MTTIHRYKAEYYDEIFEAVYSKFKIVPKNIPRWQWLSWHKQVKDMFDGGILIKEILEAIDEASEKKKWPLDTSFWHRVKDVVLVHRRMGVNPVLRGKANGTTATESNMQSIKSILNKKI
jgi:hypothetical protein